ncbi:MAG: SCO1664 family protein [Acidothermus sp.]|nr:SCO1664 family protein [Acidothermus sp.]MCL6537991.1 SCO1664 family protein [Acidothermus sp.]
MSELAEAELLRVLAEGTLRIEGQLLDASNTTLYCCVSLDSRELRCVYKPVAGERPLWDFPDHTLSRREVAAYLVSAATGWDIVPPTVFRDGPFGPGACQLWIDVDPDVDLIELLQSDDPGLQRIAVFDAVVNNADRKGGHLLPTPGGHIYGVDHGVCFAVPDKLRTVLWQWRGQPLPDEAVDTLQALACELDGELGGELIDLLSPREVAATRRRVRRLLASRRFPEPSDRWPAIPWPPL